MAKSMKKTMKAAMKAKKASGMKKKAASGMKKKAKRVSKIARGKQRKSLVFKGKKEKTAGGLKKSDLIRNKHGKVVSKKLSAGAKKKTGGWLAAVAKARAALKIKGFCAVGGKKGQGKALLAKARSFYKKK